MKMSRLISPSGFNKLMNKGKSQPFGETAKSYAHEIITDILGCKEDIDTFDMQRGRELEPFAIEAYEYKNFVQVEQKVRIKHYEIPYITGECDGLVGKNGMVEVKCPKSHNHLSNLLNNKQLKLYQYQIQGYLDLYQREWCDFVSYHPDFPKNMQLHQFRVYRDDKVIKELKERAILFWETLIQPIIKKYDIKQESINGTPYE